MTDAREAKYGEVIWDTSRADEGTISATGANIVARAVMAVADEELAEARAEVERWQKVADIKHQTTTEANARAEAAEAREAALRAQIKALADEYRRSCNPAPYTSERALIERLEALASSPAEDTAPTEQQAQDGA